MSAYWKIPLQVLVLVVGILTFVFYVFHPPPMLFNPVHDRAVRESALAPSTARSSSSSPRRSPPGGALPTRWLAPTARVIPGRSRVPKRRSGQDDAAMKAVRQRATVLVRQATGDARYADVNYVFPTFIMTALPIGLVGLWIVAIITAATDTIAAELNSLATATVIDFYKRHLRPAASDGQVLRVSKVATAAWGLFACVVAVYASSLGSLIEVVNRFGSFFYGSILGVFLLAFFARRATGTGAFVGLLAGMASVAAVAFGRPDISFLWHNVVGATVVFVVGLTIGLVTRGPIVARAGS